MAEYYPLLARAVAGMRNAPPEQRRAIYDRARQALLGQLRTMQPPVPEESINRESVALDEAIARVEADIAPVAPPPATEPALPSIPAGPPAAPPSPPTAAPPSPPPPSSLLPPFPVPPPVTGVEIPPAQPRSFPPLPQRPVPARPAADALSRIVAERPPQPPVLRATRPEDEPTVPAADPTARSTPLPSAPRLQVPSFADAMMAAEGEAPSIFRPADIARRLDDEAPYATTPAREEAVRPPAPRPVIRQGFNPRFLILTVVGALVIAGIAYAAWRLRDKPDQLARSRDAMIAAQQAEQQNAKVNTRADGSAAQGPATTTTAVPAAPAPAATPPDSAASPAQEAVTQPATPMPTPSLATPISSSAGQASTPAPAAESSALQVAQRAAFLIDAPEEPQKIKTFVGTVVWSTDNASPAQGQPISRTVRADVDIPDAALKMTMVFQKNQEAQFPASHTLEVRFTVLPNNTLGAIKQINVPQMRLDEKPAGDTLIGLPVTITENYFLVGLSRGDAVAHNLDLIKTRNWFDIPILLTSGKVAKITFEKGTPGTRAIDEVLQSWQ